MSLQNIIVGLSGEKGAGKSTLLRQLARDEPAIALIDTLGEHAPWCPEHPGSPKQQIADLGEPPETFAWSFLLTHQSKKAERAHFDGLCKAAYRAGDLTFAIEECNRYSNANGDLDFEGLQILYDYGRHRRVNLVWLTRNLVSVSRTLTSQTDAFYLFRQNEPNFVRDLGKRITAMGYNADLADALAVEVLNLPKFSYILCAKGQEPVRGQVSLERSTN